MKRLIILLILFSVFAFAEDATILLRAPSGEIVDSCTFEIGESCDPSLATCDGSLTDFCEFEYDFNYCVEEGWYYMDVTYAPGYECPAGNCNLYECDGFAYSCELDDTLFRYSRDGKFYSYGNSLVYLHSVCYSDIYGGLYEGISLQECNQRNGLFYAEDLSDSFIEQKGMNNYNNEICYGDLFCKYESSCSEDYNCIGSMDQVSGSLIGGCSDYDTKICCINSLYGGGPVLEGPVENCIMDVYFEKIRIAEGDVANLIIVGTGNEGCSEKIFRANISEDDENYSYFSPEFTIQSGDNIIEWTSVWVDDNTNRNQKIADWEWWVDEGNPEYFATLEIMGENAMKGYGPCTDSSDNHCIEVKQCNVLVDSDCDGICDLGVTEEEAGDDCEITGTGDLCDDTNIWEYVNSEGCSVEQEGCMDDWDCSVDNPFDDSSGLLEWSDCENGIRNRQLCLSGDCCSSQENCWCKMPEDENCIGFVPPSEKSCVETEKFPIFSGFNIFGVLVLLVLYFLFGFRKK